MQVPLSWVKDYVDVDLDPIELARKLTMAGLEVEEIRLVGSAVADSGAHDFKVVGLSWDPDKIVVAQVDEVLPHPNADRLVLCRLNDGLQELIVLTGAPNLFEYKGKGPLAAPLKVAYAKEGARLYDGHQPGQVLTTLKRAKIRGVDSFSMVCSEKELGISEEHEGIIILDAGAPTGMPLAEYMGDVVYEINILPNMIRDANMLGVAREIAAITGKPLRQPDAAYTAAGPAITGKAGIDITAPELNPRFVLGLIQDVAPRTSPYHVQNRLRLAGMRPINSIVDATNYVMLEIGEPLHAFDYDVLVERAGGKAPTIITRTARSGEKLTTLDGVEHSLNDFTVLVCDTAGALSIAGVMGGAESEVTEKTRNVLLEGANWNYINIRRTIAAQKMTSEAAFRYSRGIHPALSSYGVQLCLKYMLEWGGGAISQGLIDAYPRPFVDPEIRLTSGDINRLLGLSLSAPEIAGLLERLEFTCRVEDDQLVVKAPPTRTDIGEGIIGIADLAEEVARMYGYDNIPATRLQDVLPVQRGNRALELEEQVRDTLVGLGLQEVINYRLTSPEREALLLPKGEPAPTPEYIRLKNPMSSDRAVMRRSLLSSVVDTLERNIRLRPRLAMFEIGRVFIPGGEGKLPAEPTHLAIVMTGLRQRPSWDQAGKTNLDFFDLKGVVAAMLEILHVSDASYCPAQSPSFHPGKSAQIMIKGMLNGAPADIPVGILGELHPLVKENYDLGSAPVLAADIDLDALYDLIPWRYETGSVPVQPPVLEDIAVIVDESLPAGQVEAVIRQAGGKMLVNVQLFDLFRSEAIGVGKKSLAYNLTYQAPDRTLTDSEATQIRQRIIRRLEQDLGAKLRS